MSQKRRIGVVGLGMASTPHALALKDLADRVEVAGCFSPNPDRRAAFASRHHLPVVDHLKTLLNDASIDAMMLLTPPNTHQDLVAACAAAGKAVLLEKPLDATPEGARAVVQVMQDANLPLAVVFQHRFRPAVEKLALLLREGLLGQPISAACSVRWWRDNAYFSQPGRGIKARDGGGVLLTQAIHTLDVFVSLLGLPADVVAYCATSALRRQVTSQTIDTEDVVAAALRYDHGLLATVNCTTAAYPGHPESIELAGTLGSARLEGDRLFVQFTSGDTLVDGPEAGSLGGGADPMAFSHHHHRAVLADFLDALDHQRPARASGAEALKVHHLIEAILKAAETGLPTSP